MNLSPSQLAAATTAASNTLVLSVAGSGKTATLVARIRHLIDTDTDPESIVVIVYTVSAAEVLKERITEKLGYVGTLHGYCLQFLERNADAIGFQTRITVLSPEQEEVAFKEHQERLAIKATDKAIKALKSSILLEAQAPVNLGKCRGAELLVWSWYLEMLNTGALTYDGLLFWFLRSSSKGGYEPMHLLVDEVQDMSRIDLAIYDSMHCLTRWMCGDSNQAIFTFRGSVPYICESLSRRQHWETMRLDASYRCCPEVAEAANKIAGSGMASMNILTQGYVEVEECKTIDEEMCEVFFRIKDYEEDFTGNSCAVLLRTNYLVQQWTEGLKKLGIPVATTTHPERPSDWQRALLLLTLLANPDNDTIMKMFISDGGLDPKKVHLIARLNGLSINQSLKMVPEYTPVSGLAFQLKDRGISDESIDLVRNCSGETIPELLVELRNRDREETVTGSGVAVMTLHASKSREFDSVFLPCLAQCFWKEAEEEQRRLLYVGVTRAKRHVYLSSASKYVTEYSGEVTTEPLKILSEL